MNKRKSKKSIICLVIILISLLFIFTYIIFSNSTPDVIGTTIDFKNKEIMDKPYSRFDDFVADVNYAFSLLSGSLLAAVDSSYINIRSGMRKEEVADLFGRKLDWSQSSKLAFTSAQEGRYYPGTYSISDSKDEVVMRELMQQRFRREVEERISTSTLGVISLPVVLKIASLIEREAGGKRDMRIISGIIWNRIWKGMSLDIDATLQYAKGTSTNWWPKVLSKDKDIVSPYNTYKRKGLPPTPIASPALAAIEAALNPIKTDCLFYLHDTHRKIHCSPTYRGHLDNIELYY